MLTTHIFFKFKIKIILFYLFFCRNIDVQPILEGEEEVFTSPPAHRTRNALKHKTQTSEQITEGSEQTQNNEEDYIAEEVIQVRTFSTLYKHLYCFPSYEWEYALQMLF